MLTVDQRRWPGDGGVADNDAIDRAIPDDFCHFDYLAFLKVWCNLEYQTWPMGRYWRGLELVTSLCYIRKQAFQQIPILKPAVVFFDMSKPRQKDELHCTHRSPGVLGLDTLTTNTSA